MTRTDLRLFAFCLFVGIALLVVMLVSVGR